MKTNIMICARKECTGKLPDLSVIKHYFESNGHEVVMHENFCREINNREFNSPFADPKRPTVFAGCSPLCMEARIKLLFKAPVEIANIREQCAWLDEEPDAASERCRRIIAAAVNQVWYTPSLKTPANVLGEKIAEYIGVIEKIGPNPFKL